eukprot:CAMPEP_0201575108 /NCGR_PEP_ID=MMETSP0190_2-20130828/20085_1 /ASSEMBLY_ACC=CAM_ASM_000263 /TAXON_ID=37353 /ORGANISM="Rosalina sp." /LENGTH=1395 /DNA_ID=CAMNT_0048004309 /DNA_START=28 /DNA_END=4215 /DNA_ORIENTATION=+
MSKQTTLNRFFTPGGGNRNGNQNRNGRNRTPARSNTNTQQTQLTPQQLADIERKHQAALERKRAWKAKQNQQQNQNQNQNGSRSGSSTLTPAMNRLRTNSRTNGSQSAPRMNNNHNHNNNNNHNRFFNQNNNNNNRNNGNYNNNRNNFNSNNSQRSPLQNTTNTALNGNHNNRDNHNGNNTNNNLRRSVRKRARNQSYAEDSDDSPIQPNRKKRRIANKIQDSDDEYSPDPNDANHETESDHTSPSPRRRRHSGDRKKRMPPFPTDDDNADDMESVEDDDEDFIMKPNHNNHNHNNSNSNSNGNRNKNSNSNSKSPSKHQYAHDYNAAEQDPQGRHTLDRINQFGCIEYDNDDNKDAEGQYERDPRFIYRNYKDYQRKTEKRLNPPCSNETKAGGASHKDLSKEKWYSHPKDFDGRDKDHPDYNPSQIKIPWHKYKQKGSKTKMTPSQEQYWKIKETRFDGILCFKVGKFYELYYDDAHTGHRFCGLSYMGAGGAPHTGFPEKAFMKHAQIFVNHGLKVYRVEQMETVGQMKARGGKIVDRKVCEVITQGTIIPMEFLSDEANYILSIAEKKENEATASVDIGICYLDYSTGKGYLGRFLDDRNRSRLRTLIIQIDPAQILYNKHDITKETLSLIKVEGKNAIIDALRNEEEFYSAEKTRNELQANEYWAKDKMPKAIKAAWKHELAMNAFGGILYSLMHTLHDNEILPSSKWSLYDPISSKCNDFLTLDGATLANLEILNNEEGGKEGTLVEFVNHCKTSFGKRMMERWLTAPLNSYEKINERLDAVDYLIKDDDFWRETINIFSQFEKLPDLERILHHLAVLGTKGRMMDQAILFEKIWDKNKIAKLLKALDGFEQIENLLYQIECHRADIQSPFINNITTIINGDEMDQDNDNDNDDDEEEKKTNSINARNIPEFASIIKEIRDSFDEQEANAQGVIKPTEGHDSEYDKIRVSLDENGRDLEQILDEIISEAGSGASRYIKWCHQKGKVEKSYQIEIPKSYRFDVPDDWHHLSSTKSVDRYHTDEIKDLLSNREALLDDEEMCLRDAARRLFAKFASDRDIWTKIVENISILDCLLSLAHVSNYCVDITMTRPQFIKQKNPKTDKAFLEIRECRHPCIDESQLNALGQQGSASTFIPNDTILGCKENDANFVIVTGPNMGGKSTLLRQTCIAVILAHIGCYVPCNYMRLTPVDRIFTRVGANDRILAGQSTFMVELEETSNILRHATNRSLVILDELGRGTSTFDGTAIAYAVAKNVINNIKCRCLFSTHYHGLTDSFIDNPKVGMYHMAFSQQGNDITFLYKFTKGICNNSFGINCAKLAGMPQKMLMRAQEKADDLHKQMHKEDNDGDAPISGENATEAKKEYEDILSAILQDTDGGTLIDKIKSENGKK